MLIFDWEGATHLLCAGELHNSSASGEAFLRRRWTKLMALNLNCVLAPVSWELLEPQEGSFCFDMVDVLLQLARESGVKLILLWFGLWKNGRSTYVPEWVKLQQQKYICCKNTNGEQTSVISPFCEAAVLADARAFTALMEYLQQHDSPQRTVLSVQVENEAGFLGGTRDISAPAQTVHDLGIPKALATWLVSQGKADQAGDHWRAAFGSNADECFMAWGFASAMDTIAKCGKRQYALPLFVNAWTEQYPGEPAHLRPCGGPAGAGLPIWRAFAKHVDAFCPDCYQENLAQECMPYQMANESLLIPEMRCDRWTPAFILYAFGELRASGVAPFGVDALMERAASGVQDAVAHLTMHDPTAPIASIYQWIQAMAPMIQGARQSGRIRGALRAQHNVSGLDLGGYHIQIHFQDSPDGFAAGGLFISPTDGEFYILAINLRVNFFALTESAADYLCVENGHFQHSQWVPDCRLNGDEQRVSFGDAPSVVRVKLYPVLSHA